ncbi:helix-turn-helix domain-containing protein [Rhodopseudomonas sp.]|uniref:helix-turn-helix domain-containing protein n=1 Tax=Rhodopseudomonas sp. TaxID=1078 RepID=UPI0039E5D0DC
MAKTELSENLRRARLAAALSQVELAKKVGVAQPTISTWENGTSRPDSNSVKKLERILGSFVPRANADRMSIGAPEIGAFGAWLQKARVAAEVSIPELAALTDLSLATIYNIESGRSPNPQTETRRRLEKALNQEVPKDVANEAADEQNVPGIGTLLNFDPHNMDQLPSLPGVYVFYDISDRPVYIGKGDNIALRVRSHQEKKWFVRPIVENGSYVEIKEAKLRHSVEQVLIKFLKSNAIINKQSVDR